MTTSGLTSVDAGPLLIVLALIIVLALTHGGPWIRGLLPRTAIRIARERSQPAWCYILQLRLLLRYQLLFSGRAFEVADQVADIFLRDPSFGHSVLDCFSH